MRKFFLLIATLGLLSLSNSASSAHSQIISTNPTQEATVEALPKKISITFSEEPLEIQGNEINTLTVYGPSNKIISASEIIINKKTLSASLMANENFSGTYTVRYRIASQDGHVLTGDYKFYLDQPKAAVQQTPVAPIQNAAIDNSLSAIRQYATYIIGASVVAMLLFHRKKRSKG